MMTDLQKLINVFKEINVEDVELGCISDHGYQTLYVNDTASDSSLAFTFLQGKYEYCNTVLKED